MTPAAELWIQGGKPLRGEVVASGAKNAVLKLLAASLLTAEPCEIGNVPRIADVETMVAVLRAVGARVEWVGPHRLRVQAREVWPSPPARLVQDMRASIQVMGPLLARLGRARLAYPGGCAIGSRPIDFHLAGFRALGAAVREENGEVEAVARRLVGAEIRLPFPSVGATENLMMAAVLARGTTRIRGAAREPEVVEVQRFLNQMGARVQGAGTDTIEVHGVATLGGAVHDVIPDRIEAATFLLAGAVTGGEVVVRPAVPQHLGAVLTVLAEAGVEVEEVPGGLACRAARSLRPVCVRSEPYPGFPTDVQPQLMALLSLARGASLITEGVHTARFRHVPELVRLGANIRVEGRTAVVQGVPTLSGARVTATDLRAGAALVLAALAARGVSVVEGVHHLDRGYEVFHEKLAALGACIQRVTARVPSRLGAAP